MLAKPLARGLCGGCPPLSTSKPNQMEANMTLNLNEAETQRDQSPIPAGIYRLRSKVKVGGAGDDGILRLSQSGATEGLNLELTVVSGEYAGAKLYDLITVNFLEGMGPLDASKAENYRTAVRLGRTKLRAILESAHGIDPKDSSERAQEQRRVESFTQFDAITFVAQVEVQPARGGYKAKNVVDFIITPDLPDWAPPLAAAKAVTFGRKSMDDEIPFSSGAES